MTRATDILTSLMDAASEDAELPELLCREACRSLGVTGTGIALMDSSGAIERVVGSDKWTVELERLQQSLGEGPCIDAYESGRLILRTDLAGVDAQRWPLYAPAARDLGVAAMYCYPLQIGAIRLGALDIFADQAHLLPEEALGQALDYSEAAILVLLHLQSREVSAQFRGDGDGNGDAAHPGDAYRILDAAFASYPEVHQATGMVSVQAGVSLRDALLMLRARAFATERHLHDVARDVLERKLRFSNADF